MAELANPKYKGGEVKGMRYGDYRALMGELLTIAETITEDKERRKAIKSLISKTVSEFYRELFPVIMELELKGQAIGEPVKMSEEVHYELAGNGISVQRDGTT